MNIEELIKQINTFMKKTYFTKEDLLKVFKEDELLELFRYVNSNDEISNFIIRCKQLGINFMPEEMENKLKKLLEMDNVDEDIINQSFTFKEKVFLINYDSFSAKSLQEKCRDTYFFTEKEALELLLDNPKRKHIFTYLKCLKDGKLLEPYIDSLKSDLLLEIVENCDFQRKLDLSPTIAKKIYDRIPTNIDKIELVSARTIMAKLLSDEDIEKIILSTKDKSFRRRIIFYLKDPKYQQKYLNKLDRYDRVRFISENIEEDEVKMGLLSFTTFSKGEIIASFKDDKNREKMLLKFLRILTSRDLGEIIASFKDPNYIEKYLYLIKSEKSKEIFVRMISSQKKSAFQLKVFESLKKKSDIVYCVNYLFDEEKKIEIIKNKIEDVYSLMNMFMPIDAEINHVIFKKLDFSNQKILIEGNNIGENDIFYFYKHIESNIYLHEIIEHTEYFPDYEEKHDEIITRIAKFKNYSPKRLIHLSKIFGLSILSKIENENINSLMRLNDGDYNKIMSFFSNDTLNFEDNNQNDALNALIQRKFRIKNADDILIFSRTLHAIEAENYEMVSSLLAKICKVVELSDFNINKEDLFKGLINKDKKTIDIYKNITNEYVRILRTKNDFEEKKLADILYTDNPYDKNVLIKYVLKMFPIDSIINKINIIYNTNKEEYRFYKDKRYIYTPEEIALINDPNLLRAVLEFKKDPRSYSNPERIVKQNIKVLEGLINKTYQEFEFPGLKKEKKTKQNNKLELLEMLCDINIKQVKDTILNDEEKYQELLTFMKKKKVHCWLGRFDKLPEEADITIEPSVFASLISNYNEIRKYIFKEETNKIKDILVIFLNNIKNKKSEEIILEALKNGNHKLDMLIAIEDMALKCNIPIENLVKKLCSSAEKLETTNIESIINTLNPEIKSYYSKNEIYELLKKIRTFNWRISYEEIIKNSQIEPDEKELKDIFSIIEKINEQIPELNEAYILQNFFEAAITYNNISLKEALKIIDSKINGILDKEQINSILTRICKFIKNTKKHNLVSTTSIIDVADCYDSISQNLKFLFGKEDYTILKSNPIPNRSSYTTKMRIEIATKLLIDMRNREYITVPPSREVYELPKKKKIKISVGDIHSIDNLTLGERTGACMRIGGAGYSLFNFCLLNENGFHVKFIDPETNKVVSRVSGFRNGNTVFLNQLRLSLSEKYTNQDLGEACRLFAKKLIEDSKDSKYPIQNVVISPDHAMSYYDKNTQNLGINDIKKGFKSFYSDVRNPAVVLATSNPDNSLVPIELGPTNSEKYPPLRKEIVKKYGRDAKSSKNQILLLDEYYLTGDYESVDLEDTSDIIYTIQGEDWYITVDSSGKIDTYVMKSSKNKTVATEEMTSELETLKEYINKYGLEEIKEQSILGGI